jgi:hypothetical protein
VKLKELTDIDLSQFVKICLNADIDAHALADLIEHIKLEEFFQRNFNNQENQDEA